MDYKRFDSASTSGTDNPDAAQIPEIKITSEDLTTEESEDGDDTADNDDDETRHNNIGGGHHGKDAKKGGQRERKISLQSIGDEIRNDFNSIENTLKRVPSLVSIESRKVRMCKRSY